MVGAASSDLRVRCRGEDRKRIGRSSIKPNEIGQLPEVEPTLVVDTNFCGQGPQVDGAERCY